ncbi:hypothetical protein EV175_004804, partial [Coemansia sp. RSA 1933]
MDHPHSKYTSPSLDDGAPRYGSSAPLDLASPSSPHLLTTSHIGPDGKRQRVSRACDKCRRKKVKCDGKLPVCTHCEELGYDCTYLDATKKRGPPKGYIDVIESRLHKVDELIRGL